MCKYFVFNIPIDLGAAFIGGLIGLILVLLWEWLVRPRIFWFDYTFIKEKVNFGILYKLKFKVRGLRTPGFCECQIRYCGNFVRGKWDDLPNPLRDDDLNSFEPSLVPQTFFLPLMLGQYYTIPVLHEDENEKLTVFSGWWFGRRNGLPYGPDPSVNNNTEIKLIIKGNDLLWEKSLTVDDIIRRAK
jgi:hypothetical protein